jgi:serine/threonine protein kinase
MWDPTLYGPRNPHRERIHISSRHLVFRCHSLLLVISNLSLHRALNDSVCVCLHLNLCFFFMLGNRDAVCGKLTIPTTSREARSLLKKMLKVDPQKRATASQIRNRKWVRKLGEMHMPLFYESSEESRQLQKYIFEECVKIEKRYNKDSPHLL